MSMTVLNLMVPSGAQVYYTAEWRKLVNDHLLWLRQSGTMDVVTIDDHLGYKYRGDLDGALLELGIPMELHFITMRINGFVSSTAFDGTAGMIMVPTRETIDKLLRVMNTVAR